MIFLFFRWLWSKFSDGRRELNARIRGTVKAWVKEKGYERPMARVAEIADDIGLPPDQLSGYVRTKSRNTILGWRKRLRISEAKRLMVKLPDVPVAEIGRMVGINDKSNFRKQFTETCKMSPRAWREKHRKRTRWKFLTW